MSKEVLDDIDFDDGNHDEAKEALLRTFMQRRADLYIQFWKKPRVITFDFLKLLVGLPWLLYRKMYAVSFVLGLLCVFIVGIKKVFFLVPVFGLIYWLLNFQQLELSILFIDVLGVALIVGVCGFFSQSTYVYDTQHKIRMLESRYFGDELLAKLKEKGGVEGVVPSILFLGLLMYLLSSMTVGMNPILTF